MSNKLFVGDIITPSDPNTKKKIFYLIMKRNRENFFGELKYVFHILCLNDGCYDYDSQAFIQQKYERVA